MEKLHVICARRFKRNPSRFVAEPGTARYLAVEDAEGAVPSPDDAIAPAQWLKAVMGEAVWHLDEDTGERRGDILFFVHGYNNSSKEVISRHRQLKSDLAAAGWKGAVVSYDWPSAASALNYLEDRHDAKQSAVHLVESGIKLLAKEQTPDCRVNIHVLAHSMGAYVVREAFDDADDCALANSGWRVSQIAFVGGDVSSASMAAGNSRTSSLYRHCTRLTNYSSRYDGALKLSNIKRAGNAPRAGRVGLPDDVPEKAVCVNCSDYFDGIDEDHPDQVTVIGRFDHSWYFGNMVFARDLFETLKGEVDRTMIATRERREGALHLVKPG